MQPISIARIPFILDAYLAQTVPDAPIAYQGLDFTPPENRLWLRPLCSTGSMVDMEKGPEGCSRRMGLYLVDIFAPSPLCAADAWNMAARLETAFRRVALEGVQTQDPHTENRGLDAADNLFIRVTVPWWAWSV